jgi:hypothetical protein
MIYIYTYIYRDLCTYLLMYLDDMKNVFWYYIYINEIVYHMFVCVCVPFEYMHELIAPVLCGEVVNLGRRCAVIDVHTSSLKMFKLDVAFGWGPSSH